MKHQEIHPEGIEGCDENTRQYREVCKPRARQMTEMNSFNDAVLGIETREQGSSNQGQGPEQRRDPSDGHVLAQTTHPSDVLIVMNTHDDRTSGQEQQRLEKRVGHQMEHRNRVCGSSQRHCHVAQLGQRGIGHNPLDVVLDDAQKSHEESGDGPNDQHEIQCNVTELKHR